MRDVIVVGGGPAGLYAARELSRSGFDVSVIEEHSSIGRPVHCTGVLAVDAYTEYDLPSEAILNELNTVRFFSPLGRRVSYTHDRTEAVVIDRAVFDEALSMEAQAAGATVISGSRVTGIQPGTGGVQISLATGETLQSRSCVLACGANYTLHRNLDLGRPPLLFASAQAEFLAAHSGDVEVHFNSDVAPKGFAWVVPVRRAEGNHVRVGLMCESQVEERFKRFASSIAPRWGLMRQSEISPVRKILPLAPIARTYANRLLVVGDAAGLVKSTTGGGIYYGIVSAALAAEVLAESLKSDTLDDWSLAKYEQRWKEQLGAELDAQFMFRKRANALLDSDIEDLFELACTDGLLSLVRKTARFNCHRMLIYALLRDPQFQRVLFRRLS